LAAADGHWFTLGKQEVPGTHTRVALNHVAQEMASTFGLLPPTCDVHRLSDHPMALQEMEPQALSGGPAALLPTVLLRPQSMLATCTQTLVLLWGVHMLTEQSTHQLYTKPTANACT
jgi:hypothetical protein